MLLLLPWWALLTILSLLALPLTMSLLRNLPDRGYPFARFVGVLLPAFLAWTLGMWQLATFGRALLLFCLLLLAVLSGFLLWRDRTILAFFRERWRLVLTYELLFALALFVGAILRIYADWGGPAISHTEQPMDFALMNGIIRSPTLPPRDPWLAGYSINYYYLGYFLAASLTLLVGLPSSITFNLNLALLFALAAGGAFSLAYNLAMAVAPEEQRRALLSGALAAIFLVGAGNQVGALQVLTGSNQIAPLDAGELWTALTARPAGDGSIPLGHTVYIAGNDFGGQFDAIRPTPDRQNRDFDWWWPSRVLWDERPSWEAVERFRAEGMLGQALLRWRSLARPEEVRRSYTITEFPFFSFYLGDMHPHVMAIPLTLLAVALALNIVLAPERGLAALAPGRRGWFFLALNAVVLGGLYMMNSWDLPTYLLLYGAAWVWRWSREGNPRDRAERRVLFRDLGILLGMCLVLYLPFFLTFRSLVGSKPIPAELLDLPLLGVVARLPLVSKLFQTVGPVLWDKTSLHTLLVILGLFLYPALTWPVAQRVRQGKVSPGEWVGFGVVVLLAVLLRFPLLLLLPFLWLGWRLLGQSRPAEAMALLMLLLALLLLLGCELVYIRDVFESRMNTIFKFYYQAWLLLAIVGAWSIGQAGRAYLRRPLAWTIWAVPLVLLLLGALVYPVQALRRTLPQEREWTLDGLAYMAKTYPGDYAAVRWLWENAEAGAVVLEAVGPEWGYHGRISAATGLPTLLGWDGHELQWRGGDPQALAEIAPRRDVVERIYQTTNPAEARQLLQQYDVDYIVLGSLEAGVSAESREALARFCTLVFESAGVQIYRVPSVEGP